MLVGFSILIFWFFFGEHIRDLQWRVEGIYRMHFHVYFDEMSDNEDRKKWIGLRLLM